MQSAKELGQRNRAPVLKLFLKGAAAGGVALVFNFLLRLGSVAPFPPESGIESFLRIIPESIQEPAVQKLGDLAGQLGLISATIIAIVVYGILAIVFERSIYSQLRFLSHFERYLAYSIVPWILFGIILLPLFGVSFFGVSSVFATSSNSLWLFPISLLFVQLAYSISLYSFSGNSVYSQSSLKKTRQLPESRDISRRSFVEKGAIGVGLLALSLTSLDKLLTVPSPSSGPSTQGTPISLGNAPSIFRDPRLIPLVDGEITPNNSFYRVAIDLFDPDVNASSWALQLSGLVNAPKSFNLQSLQNTFTPTEQYNTFECVSNFINGNLISNAKWTGVKISEVINAAGGASSGAQYVVFYSVDGYSVAIPLSKALMSDSIVAYNMNDEPLPQSHGYPLRAVIPGLYGMMSAKWINRIELVDSPYSGYWQTRGWSPTGVVQTVAFITVPTSKVSLSQYNGSVILGGTAYAGDRGISKVEVSVDGGKTWQSAELKPTLARTSWTLWAFDWHPTSTGTYNIYARATDGTGAIQTSQNTDTFPNGATGYAMISVNVGS